MMISVYYKKKISLNGYLCDMDTARKHGRTFSVLCDCLLYTSDAADEL